jgi:hypothetical protein
VPDRVPESRLSESALSKSTVSKRNEEMPGTAIWAIAAGTAPLPFLLIYSILFVLRGTVVPVSPPDITTTQHGEAVAGVVAFAYLIVIVVGIFRFMSQRGRWLMMASEAACLAICVDLFVDPSSGDPVLPVVIGAASALTLVSCVLRPSWEWISGTGT